MLEIYKIHIHIIIYHFACHSAAPLRLVVSPQRIVACASTSVAVIASSCDSGEYPP